MRLAHLSTVVLGVQLDLSLRVLTLKIRVDIGISTVVHLLLALVDVNLFFLGVDMGTVPMLVSHHVKN